MFKKKKHILTHQNAPADPVAQVLQDHLGGGDEGNPADGHQDEAADGSQDKPADGSQDKPADGEKGSGYGV